MTSRSLRVGAVVTAGALAGLGGVASGAPAPDPGRGAEKVALHEDFSDRLGFCRGSATTPAKTGGFAVIKSTSDRISATVSLKEGLPGVTYDVHLVQVPSSGGCFAKGQADLPVNDQGNGTVHLSVPRRGDTTSAWIYLERNGFFAFVTEEVAIDIVQPKAKPSVGRQGGAG